jgi:hypothetical protein
MGRLFSNTPANLETGALRIGKNANERFYWNSWRKSCARLNTD